MSPREEITKYFPRPGDYEQFSRIIAILENNLSENFAKEQSTTSFTLANLVYQKLVTTEPTLRWTKSDYVDFKYSLNKLTNENLEYVLPSYLKILTASSTKILEDLNYIAKNSYEYPIVNRRYNNKTNQYDSYFEEISPTDSLKIIYTFHHKILNFIRTQARQIFKSEDNETLYESLYEIYKSGTEREKNKILRQFDEQFSFLEKSFICRDIYLQYREKYFLCLLLNLRQMNNLKYLGEIDKIKTNYQARLEGRKERKVIYEKKRKEEGKR